MAVRDLLKKSGLRVSTLSLTVVIARIKCVEDTAKLLVMHDRGIIHSIVFSAKSMRRTPHYLEQFQFLARAKKSRNSQPPFLHNS